jgi:hypothetical protein
VLGRFERHHGVDIDARHNGRDSRHQSAAMPFAARDIDAAFPCDIAPRKRVAMPLLVGDLAGDTRDESPAGEIEVGRQWVDGTGRNVPVPQMRASPIWRFSRGTSSA